MGIGLPHAGRTFDWVFNGSYLKMELHASQHKNFNRSAWFDLPIQYFHVQYFKEYTNYQNWAEVQNKLARARILKPIGIDFLILHCSFKFIFVHSWKYWTETLVRNSCWMLPMGIGYRIAMWNAVSVHYCWQHHTSSTSESSYAAIFLRCAK